MKDIDPWNHLARAYSQWLDSRSDRGGNAFAQALQAAICRRLPENRNATVLDLGCGNGNLLTDLRARYDRVTGLDGALSMVALAKRKALTRALCTVGDILESLPFLSGSFDVVISNMVLMSVEDADCVFHEVARVLKINGIFIFTISHPCFSFARHHLGNGQHRYLEQFRAERPLGSTFDMACITYHRPLQFYLERTLHSELRLRDFEEVCISASSAGLDSDETSLHAYYMTANAVLFEAVKSAKS
jgi:SAM-dependent methyltransferase